MANTTVTPGVGALRLTTNVVIGPLVAALTLSGAVSSVNQSIAPGQASLICASAAPGMDLGIPGTASTLNLSGTTAALSYGSAIAPGTGSVALVGLSSGLFVGTVTPNAGGVTLSGVAPTVNIANVTFAPSTGTIHLDSANAVLSGGSPPATAALIWSGGNPALGVQLVLTPAGTAPLSLSGVSVNLNLTISPRSGALAMTTRSSPIVASAGQIGLNGNAPIVSGPIVMAPLAGAVTFAGVVSGQTLSVPAPPTAALVFGGSSPGLLLTHMIQSAAGAMSLASNAPAVVQSQIVTMTNGSINLGGAAPLLSVNLLTSSGSLQLTGVTVVLSGGTILTPTVGTLSVVGASPVETPGGSISIGAGALTLAGSVPTLSPGIVSPSAGMTLSTAAPQLNLGIATPSAALALSGAVPSVNGRATLAIGAGAIVVGGAIPRLGLSMVPTVASVTYHADGSALDLGQSPLPGMATLGGATPALAVTGFPQAQTGTLTLASDAAVLNLGMVPRVATLTVNGIRAVVNSLLSATPNTGAVTMVSDAPLIANLAVPVPITGSITFGADAPLLFRTGFAAPQTGVVSMASDTPLVQQTTNGFFTPGTAALVLTGQPAVIPLYDPDPYHTVASPGPDRYTVHSPG